MESLRTAPISVSFLPDSITLSFMPGIHAGNPLKSLTTRHTRSSGALMTVLTKAFGIPSPSLYWPGGVNIAALLRAPLSGAVFVYGSVPQDLWYNDVLTCQAAPSGPGARAPAFREIGLR